MEQDARRVHDRREERGALRGEELLKAPAALLEREQDSFPRRSAHEDAVDTAIGEKGDVRRERHLVEGIATFTQRRQGSGKSA